MRIASAFACGNIDILPGEAPMTITGKADAVFMGGSGGHLMALIDWAMGHLPSRWPSGDDLYLAGKTSIARWRILRASAHVEWTVYSFSFHR
ncbi:cobalt-precorrin-6Y C(15)-methyltransferase [Salmonella enterica subsp. arizonae]|uniref:Cobalt-precorrin-6Y C(15)-methyltransferase n=1 Tax=Salmonella enterica subsp. arizonae TaxID=59203 RepID=A0A2X4T9G0_SALER|nr:cobalt-precorrin-6Y C(15)-methyltransferase [Salmonella enterica subsp. arizonae]